MMGLAWVDGRIQRAMNTAGAKGLDAGLAQSLANVRPLVIELVLSEPAPLGDLVSGSGRLGHRLAAETGPGLYAISANDSAEGEYLRAGKAVDRPLRGRLSEHVNSASYQGGSLFYELLHDRFDDRWRNAGEASTRQWLRSECVARWLCRNREEVERDEGLVLGLLAPRYPLDGPHGEKRGGKPWWTGV